MTKRLTNWMMLISLVMMFVFAWANLRLPENMAETDQPIARLGLLAGLCAILPAVWIVRHRPLRKRSTLVPSPGNPGEGTRER